MATKCIFKTLFVLGLVGVGLSISADPDSTGRSKYKYGYVISHKEGTTQAHLASRDGNLALGRYYVNLPNGNGQKVTYFADDLGYYTGVFYSSKSEKGSSKTQIAMGLKALAAFGNSDSASSSAFTASTFPPYFGKKILKTLINTVSAKPGAYPQLNYTPVPGGFYLTHESVDLNGTTQRPNYGSTSQTFSTYKDFDRKYSGGVVQSKTNTQSFQGTSGNVKNEINQLHIQSTTPSIKSYSSVPQVSAFSGNPGGTNQFSQQGRTVKVSSFVTGSDGFSYSKQKSVEKTNFEEIDAQIISEVQKHAEQIIMKDLHKNQNVNFQSGFPNFSPAGQQLSSVTMQPIVVTDGGEININHIVSSTAIPEVRKTSSKDLQSGSINSVRITEKSNSDQTAGDGGFFRVSLSPSFTSSINVSPAPQQLIDGKSSDRNSDSNNSSLCNSNLCEKDGRRVYSSTSLESSKENERLDPEVSDSKSSKITHSFYPKNQITDERHYVTTIDVQKGISLDVQQNEDGSIQLAENFQFNKIKPFQNQQQNQFIQSTPAPVITNQISVTPGVFAPDPNLNVFSTPEKPYSLSTATASPALFDVTPNQNFGVLQGFNDVSPNPVQYTPQVQDRIENNRGGYESQLVPPAPPVVANNPPQNQIGNDLSQVEKNIQELRQQIVSSIDAQHEEEQRKQNLIDEERRQYFENLKKVENLKEQSSLAYNLGVSARPDILQATASPAPPFESTNTIQLSSQAQYVHPTQTPSYNAELKGFSSQVPVVYSNSQPTPSPDIYSKSAITFNPQEFQTSSPLTAYSPQAVHGINLYSENNSQQTAYSDNNVQQTVSSYANVNVQPAVPTFTVANTQPGVSTYTNANEQPAISTYTSANVQPAQVYTSTNSGPAVSAYTSANVQPSVQAYTSANLRPAVPAFTSANLQAGVPAYTSGNVQQAVSVLSNANVQPVVPAFTSSSVQQPVPTFTNSDVQRTVTGQTTGNVAQVIPAYITSNLQQSVPVYAGNAIPQAIPTYEDNTIQPSAFAAQKVELTKYVQPVTPISLYGRYAASHVEQAEINPSQLQVALVPGQINTVPVGVLPQIPRQENKIPDVSKALLVNQAVPFDYSRLFQSSLLQSYPVSLPTESPMAVPAVYAVPQPVAVPVQVPQTYKFLSYPNVPPPSNKQYHSTLTQKATNKLRVQPLKPSVPDEESQREAVKNFLAQPQFHPTYYYPGVYNNRLQLRHIRKNQISNSDQVPSQSLTRRGKSLKNLRIEYGFKPPLRPSVEFSEEVKPSIYGPSVQPQ